MQNVPYSRLSKGTLLLASPDTDTGIYFRSVLLLCEHSPGGSFGIVINKPLDIQLPEELFNQKEFANPHVHMRVGGPVQPNQMMILHSSDQVPEQTLSICDGVYLGGDLQFLREAAANPHGPHICLCFGYAGWRAGHLEHEFLGGKWFLHPASAHYIFETPPEKAWQTILRDMGGKYASLSMIPEDLSVN